MVDSASTDETFDPYDLASLRVNHDYATMSGVVPGLTCVPVRKPGKQDWFRVHPDPEYQLLSRVINLSREREIYLVHQDLHDALIDETREAILYTCVDTFTTVFLCPTR